MSPDAWTETLAVLDRMRVGRSFPANREQKGACKKTEYRRRPSGGPEDGEEEEEEEGEAGVAERSGQYFTRTLAYAPECLSAANRVFTSRRRAASPSRVAAKARARARFRADRVDITGGSSSLLSPGIHGQILCLRSPDVRLRILCDRCNDTYII